MAIAEGISLIGYTGEVVVIDYTKPTSGTGATTRSHAPTKVVEAKTNQGQTQMGVALRRYAPVLSVLFGTEDF